MRIGLVGEAQQREHFEQVFERCERRDELFTHLLFRAETSYISRHLECGTAPQPSPMGDSDTYNDQVRRLRAGFHARPETKAFKKRVSTRSHTKWQALAVSVQNTIQHQNDTRLSRDDFMAQRARRSILSRGFKRAIRR